MLDMLDPNAPIGAIGAGQAGFAAASKLRDLEHVGPIALIGAEPEPPYQRPPLSKAYLLGEINREQLLLRPLRRHDRVIARAGPGATRSHWYFRKDRLEAVDAMNDPRSFMVAKRVLESGIPVKIDLIADPASDLRALLARTN